MKKESLYKFLRLLKGDLFFLYKYGIFFVYAVFIAVYLVALHYIPAPTDNLVMKLLVFSDPAAMGLFFMGAVILLEKSQRVNCSIAVSPVTTNIYVISKSLAFMTAGLAVGIIIALGSGYFLTVQGIIGIAGASILYSMAGLFIASKARSLNQFIILSLPVEIIISTPAFFYPFEKLTSPIWIIHPGIAAMRLLFNQGNVSASSNIVLILLCLTSLAFWNTVVFFLAKSAVNKLFKSLGGGSL